MYSGHGWYTHTTYIHICIHASMHVHACMHASMHGIHAWHASIMHVCMHALPGAEIYAKVVCTRAQKRSRRTWNSHYRLTRQTPKTKSTAYKFCGKVFLHIGLQSGDSFPRSPHARPLEGAMRPGPSEIATTVRNTSKTRRQNSKSCETT